MDLSTVDGLLTIELELSRLQLTVVSGPSLLLLSTMSLDGRGEGGGGAETGVQMGRSGQQKTGGWKRLD